MALPNPGSSISLSQINTELGRSANAQIGVNLAENGSYVAINKCSPYRPYAPNPAKFSEWYKYNHNATCVNCWNGSNELIYDFSFGAGQNANFSPVFSITALGNFTPKLWITSLSYGLLNGRIEYWILDSNKQNPRFSGYSTIYELGAGTYNLPTVGTRYSTSDHLLMIIYFNGWENNAASGQIKISFSCPTIATCGSGNAVTVDQGNCGCAVSGSIYNEFTNTEIPSNTTPGAGIWFEVGTSNRTVTLSASFAPSPSDVVGVACNQSLHIKDGAGNVIVQNVTNPTYPYSFTFTYNGNPNIVVYPLYECCC